MIPTVILDPDPSEASAACHQSSDHQGWPARHVTSSSLRASGDAMTNEVISTVGCAAPTAAENSLRILAKLCLHPKVGWTASCQSRETPSSHVSATQLRSGSRSARSDSTIQSTGTILCPSLCMVRKVCRQGVVVVAGSSHSRRGKSDSRILAPSRASPSRGRYQFVPRERPIPASQGSPKVRAGSGSSGTSTS